LWYTLVSSLVNELQLAALGAVVLLSACQSHGFGPEPNTGLQATIAPPQMAFQRSFGSITGQRFVPCVSATTPLVESTPLPLDTPRTRSVGTFSPRTGTAYLYIADEYDSQIDIFPSEGVNQPQVGTITAGIRQTTR
jgi:hypothetical protein